ncbi:GAF domain-containing protein [Niallia oryzisoli]|uniref:GAF domain-containing protein n=1 Tax=Niallia oryzisoli TaxID=1737571 RepID=UPI0037355923
MRNKDIVVYMKQYAANKRIKALLQKINPLLAQNEENIRVHLDALVNQVISENEFQVINMKMELGKLCLDLEKAIPDGHVTMLFYCQKENKIYHGAAPNFPVEFFDFFNDINEKRAFGETCGSCGAAVHNREVVVTDIQSSPLWGPFREHFTRYGFQTGWSIPFFREDDVIGTFAIYHRTQRGVKKEEIALVQKKITQYQEAIYYMAEQIAE